MSNSLSPVAEQERNSVLDVLRGVAVLGILIMNIHAMGQPYLIMWLPQIAMELSGAWPETWVYQATLAEGSMRGLFSLLLGGGIVLLTSRLESRHGGTLPADIYFRRNLWLLVFGFVNAYLFMWPGDILFPYALFCILLFPLRALSPARLFAAAAVVLLPLALVYGNGINTRFSQHEDYLAAVEAKTSGAELSSEQEKAIESWEAFPPTYEGEKIRQQVETMRGGFGDIFLSDAVAPYWAGDTFIFFHHSFWGDLMFVVLGMALFKLGVLGGERDRRFYLKMLLVCYGLGISVGLAQNWQIYQSGFDRLLRVSFSPLYEPRRILMTLGHMCLVILVCKSGLLPWITDSLKLVGRMALTNYLTQSILAALIFYGFAGGLYDEFHGYELFAFVIAIWILQVAWSRAWLAHFYFGPFEWLWRSLTYWRRQPLRRPAAAAQAPVAEGA